MYRELLRSTLIAVGATLAIVVIPITLLVLWYVLSLRASGGDQAGFQQELQLPLLLFTWMVVLSLAALGVGFATARRRASTLVAPLSELAKRAERLGAGESRFRPLDSGIGELDRISDVLSDSAAQLTANLASERDFAADASHQLRTPLTALLMRLDEIRAADSLAVVREEAQASIEQVERLSGVIDDLMERSRTASAELPSVSLDAILAALQREWQPAFAAARRSMRVHGERGLGVRATPVALSQILSTLVENALTHGSGTVDIAARRSGPSVVIQFGDQGEGVAPNIAPHIFERSVSSTGSGLGLTLARDLAEDNGGRLELISAQPAVFAVFLSEAG